MALGSLVVDLVTDTTGLVTGFSKGTQETKKFSKSLESNINRATSNVKARLESVGTAAIGIVAGYASASFAIGKFTEQMQELDRVAKDSVRLGVTVEQLSGLEYAAGLSGASIDKVKDALKDLNKNVGEALSGNEEFLAYFNELGLNLKDAEVASLSASEKLIVLADTLGQLEDPALKSQIAMKLMGESGLALVPLLNSGSEAIRGMIAEAEGLGLVFNSEQAKEAEAYNDSIDKLSKSFDALTRASFKELTVELTSFNNSLISLAQTSEDIVEGGFVALTEIIGNAFRDRNGPGERVNALRLELQELKAELEEFDKENPDPGFFKSFTRSGLLDDIQAVTERLEFAQSRLDKVKLSAAPTTEEITAKKEEVAAREESLKTLKKETAEKASAKTATLSEKAAIEASLDSLRDQISQVGLSEEAINDLAVARLEDKAAQLEQQAAQLEGIDLMSEERQALLDNAGLIRDQAAATKELADAKRAQTEIDEATSLREENDSLKREIEEIGLTKEALLELKQARLEESAAELEAEAARIESIEGRAKEAEALRDQANALLERSVLLSDQFNAEQTASAKEAGEAFKEELLAGIEAAFKEGGESSGAFASTLQQKIKDVIIDPAIKSITSGANSQEGSKKITDAIKSLEDVMKDIEGGLKGSLGEEGFGSLVESLGGTKGQSIFQASLTEVAKSFESKGFAGFSGITSLLEKQPSQKELGDILYEAVRQAISFSNGGEGRPVLNPATQVGGFNVATGTTSLGKDVALNNLAADIGKSFESQLNDIAKRLGVSVDSMAKVLIEFNPTLGFADFSFNAVVNGQTISGLNNALADGLSGVEALAGDTITSLLANSLNSLGFQGILGELFQSVSGGSQEALDNAVDLAANILDLSKTFGNASNQVTRFIGSQSLFLKENQKELEKFFDSFGGVNNLVSAMTSFRDNFLPSSAQIVDSLGQMIGTIQSFDGDTQTFQTLAQNAFKTRSGFAALVQALDLTNDAQRDFYTELLKNQEAFNQYFNLIKQREADLVSLTRTFGTDSDLASLLKNQLESAFGRIRDLTPDLFQDGFFEFPNLANVRDGSDFLELFEKVNSLGIQSQSANLIRDELLAIAPIFEEYRNLVGTVSNSTSSDPVISIIDAIATESEKFFQLRTSITNKLRNAIGTGDVPTTLEGLRDLFYSLGEEGQAALDELAGSFKDFIDQAERARREAESRLNDAFSREIDKLEADLAKTADLRAELSSAYNRERSELDGLISSFENFGQSIAAFRRELTTGDLSGNSGVQSARALEARFNDLATRAAAGDAQAFEELTAVAGDYLSSLKDVAGSQDEYQRGLASVDEKLALAQIGAEAGIDVAQLQLNALNELVGDSVAQRETDRKISDILADISSASSFNFDVQKRIEDLQAQQADLLASVAKNTDSLPEAVRNFISVNEQSSVVESFIQSNESVLTLAASIERYADLLDRTRAPSFATNSGEITTFSNPVSTGSTDGDAQTQADQRVDAIVKELQELKEIVQAGNLAIAGNTGKTARTLERFDDGDALLVRTV